MGLSVEILCMNGCEHVRGAFKALFLSDLLRLYIFLLDISLAESHVYNLPVTMYLAPSWSCCKILELLRKYWLPITDCILIIIIASRQPLLCDPLVSSLYVCSADRHPTTTQSCKRWRRVPRFIYSPVVEECFLNSNSVTSLQYCFAICRGSVGQVAGCRLLYSLEADYDPCRGGLNLLVWSGWWWSEIRLRISKRASVSS